MLYNLNIFNLYLSTKIGRKIKQQITIKFENFYNKDMQKVQWKEGVSNTT